MDIRHTGDELCSGGVAGLAAGYTLAGVGVASVQFLQALRELPTGRPPTSGAFGTATLLIFGVFSVGAVLGVDVARRTEPGSSEAVERRLRFAGLVWVFSLGVAWFLPVEAIATGVQLEDRRLVSTGVRLGAFLLVPILGVVGASPRIRSRLRRPVERWSGISIGTNSTGRIPDRWTKLGGAVVWVCGGTPATRILTESIRQPIEQSLLPYPLGFVGAALPWALLGYWWTSRAVETRAEQSHVNAARLRLLAYAGPIAIGVLIALAVLSAHVPAGITSIVALPIVLSVPVIGVGCSYGTLLSRVGPRRVDIPADNPLRRVLGTISLQSIAIVFLVGIAASLVLWMGSGALGDYDRDGVTNGVEVLHGSDPASPDTDLDGLDDAREIGNETSATAEDTDGDGLEDGTERQLGSSPVDPDTDGDGTPDEIDDVAHTVPIRRGTDPVPRATVNLRGPARSLRGVDPTVISNRTVGPQHWHIIEFWLSNDTTGTITIPVGNATLDRHPNLTVYGVGPANYWVDDGWRALPTTVDRENGTVTAELDADRLADRAWITVSDPTTIRSAATSDVQLSQDRLYALDGRKGWRFEGSVRTGDGQFVFGESGDRVGLATRNLTVPDVTNVTLAARLNESDPDAVTIRLANPTGTLRIVDDWNRTNPKYLEREVSRFRGERVTLSIRGSSESSVEYLWFQTHSDGDSIPDAGERAAADIPGLHCSWLDGRWRWLHWSDLDLDPHRADTDADGDADDEEVHLRGRVDDENRTLRAGLRGYHSHPNRSTTWC